MPSFAFNAFKIEDFNSEALDCNPSGYHGPCCSFGAKGDNIGRTPCMVPDAPSNKNEVFVMQKGTI